MTQKTQQLNTDKPRSNLAYNAFNLETQLSCYFVMRCGEDMNDVYSKFYYFEAVGASNDNTLSDPNWQQLHSAQLFKLFTQLSFKLEL